VAAELVDLDAGDALLLALQLGTQSVVLLLLLYVFFMSVFILLADELGLLGLFFFMHYNGVLDLLLFSLSLLLHLQDALAMHVLLLLVHLHLVHLLLLLALVLLLELHNVVRSSLRLFDFLPSFHFFLLQ